MSPSCRFQAYYDVQQASSGYNPIFPHVELNQHCSEKLLSLCFLLQSERDQEWIDVHYQMFLIDLQAKQIPPLKNALKKLYVKKRRFVYYNDFKQVDGEGVIDFIVAFYHVTEAVFCIEAKPGGGRFLKTGKTEWEK